MTRYIAWQGHTAAKRDLLRFSQSVELRLSSYHFLYQGVAVSVIQSGQTLNLSNVSSLASIDISQAHREQYNADAALFNGGFDREFDAVVSFMDSFNTPPTGLRDGVGARIFGSDGLGLSYIPVATGGLATSRVNDLFGRLSLYGHRRQGLLDTYRGVIDGIGAGISSEFNSYRQDPIGYIGSLIGGTAQFIGDQFVSPVEYLTGQDIAGGATKRNVARVEAFEQVLMSLPGTREQETTIMLRLV